MSENGYVVKYCVSMVIALTQAETSKLKHQMTSLMRERDEEKETTRHLRDLYDTEALRSRQLNHELSNSHAAGTGSTGTIRMDGYVLVFVLLHLSRGCRVFHADCTV